MLGFVLLHTCYQLLYISAWKNGTVWPQQSIAPRHTASGKCTQASQPTAPQTEPPLPLPSPPAPPPQPPLLHSQQTEPPQAPSPPPPQPHQEGRHVRPHRRGGDGQQPEPTQGPGIDCGGTAKVQDQGYRSALHALHCTPYLQLCDAVHGSTLINTAHHFTALQRTTVHCTALHCTAMHCTV